MSLLPVLQEGNTRSLYSRDSDCCSYSIFISEEYFHEESGRIEINHEDSLLQYSPDMAILDLSYISAREKTQAFTATSTTIRRYDDTMINSDDTAALESRRQSNNDDKTTRVVYVKMVLLVTNNTIMEIT
eukprot:scaffold214219_cov73-Cyclotella_meneghiniana.AAC.7